MYDHLAVEFWLEVKRELMTRHGFTERRAEKDIQGYRDRLASHGVTDVLYHWNPDNIAADIQSGAFKKPLSTGVR